MRWPAAAAPTERRQILSELLSSRPAGASPRWRWTAFALSAVFVALPFLAVTFPPITDLPQQAAQIRLAVEALTRPDSPYSIQWLTPYTLSYLAMAAGWLIGGPLAAGRFGMLIIVLLWVGAAHLLAARRGRPAAAAVLASALVFNHIVYWGFYSFAIGWPVFTIWLWATWRPPRRERPWREAALFLVLAVLLYMGHALWLAAGGLWLGVWTLANPRSWRLALPRFLGMSPVLIVAAVWFAGLSQTSFASPPRYLFSPLLRFSPDWLTDSAFGGVRGPIEEAFFVVLLAWFLLALLTSRGRLRSAADRRLALAGGMFALLALTLPDQYTNTIFFANRWVPPAVVLLLLAAPAPRWRPRLLAGGAVAALLLFSLLTTMIWVQFETTEMSGLDRALAALPEEPRTLGIDLLQRSKWIEGKPFLQTFAYSQLVRGGSLNFSFAEFAPSLVVFNRPPDQRWTPHLEWRPHRLRTSDLLYFDHLLVGGIPLQHRKFLGDPIFTPLTDGGTWRLYRIDHDRVVAWLRDHGDPDASAVLMPPFSER